MSRTPRVIFAILFLGVIVSSNAAAQTREKLEAKTISLGIVAEAHQQEIEEHFRDFVHYVARKTSSASAVEGRVVIAPTLSELAKLLEQGKVDFYMDSPYPTYVVNFVHGAGAFSDDDYARLDEKRKSDISILAQTELVPRHLVSIRKDMAPALAARLGEVLIAMHEDDQGRRILQKTGDTTKFDVLPEGEEGMRRRLLETFYSAERK